MEQIFNRFKEDVKYLQSIFPDVRNIEGFILKIKVGSDISDIPELDNEYMEVNTLILGTPDNSVVLVFKPCTKKLKNNIPDGLEILSTYVFDNWDSRVHRKRPVIEIPSFLEKYLFEVSLEEHFEKSLSINMNNEKILNEDFFFKYYKKEGMIRLKEMKHNPEWNNEYMKELNIKLIYICKSCENKSYKGCCNAYSSKNRSKIKMVIGWSKK
jgi:hypothetical protein